MGLKSILTHRSDRRHCPVSEPRLSTGNFGDPTRKVVVPAARVRGCDLTHDVSLPRPVTTPWSGVPATPVLSPPVLLRSRPRLLTHTPVQPDSTRPSRPPPSYATRDLTLPLGPRAVFRSLRVSPTRAVYPWSRRLATRSGAPAHVPEHEQVLSKPRPRPFGPRSLPLSKRESGKTPTDWNTYVGRPLYHQPRRRVD